MSNKACKYLLKHNETQKPYYERMKFTCTNDIKKIQSWFYNRSRNQNLDLLYLANVLKTMHLLGIFDWYFFIHMFEPGHFTLNIIYQQKYWFNFNQFHQINQIYQFSYYESIKFTCSNYNIKKIQSWSAVAAVRKVYQTKNILKV